MSAEHDSDAALTARAGRGDDVAFRTLYRRHVTPVYRIAYAIVGTASDAEDITQETFVTAWRKLRALRLEGESLLPWLATICRYQSANRLRSLRRDRDRTAAENAAERADTVMVEDQVIGADLARRIAGEVERLSELDREIFVLCVSEGYAYVAAAERLGIAHGAVRNRLTRIRTRLRGVVEEAAES
ncbi:RNA polymerase sigma factor [Microbacterium sp. SORGH_AS_0888]|uniref:RNA polymerase sigma factor n=1 Tax=Microbacterium sp. SORGH_AS_0888 TaxID=3041791 RepID=UPI00278B4812|nr:RNA polymerase sigma factor [Microbacterium sp. SORGH_AS_0888]MDQ1128366.1 RNA polymerase sigma factor (sigma-70 family) [Microbacterium sp. SORGH_AS_0888]